MIIFMKRLNKIIFITMLILLAVAINMHSSYLSDKLFILHYKHMGIDINLSSSSLKLSLRIARWLGEIIGSLIIPFFLSVIIYLLSLIKYKQLSLWRFISIFAFVYLFFSLFIWSGILYEFRLLFY